MTSVNFILIPLFSTYLTILSDQHQISLNPSRIPRGVPRIVGTYMFRFTPAGFTIARRFWKAWVTCSAILWPASDSTFLISP